jgi:glyoxylase-like metal-dependent hydrolase (beta-lactamase superfamily II)/rhodanese-related sulfurtransferase
VKLHLIPIVDEGLGNSTYLLDLGSGTALVVDPERDVRKVRAEARRLGLSIVFTAETHLHADFISGVRELAETEGATILAPEVGPRDFAYTSLKDGEELRLGAYTLKALATPGHSPEHLSFMLLDGDHLAGVFTGGSLLVGTAGRTDLVNPEMTVPLARAQYRSLELLMQLPDETPVWPTHGAGSFCSAAAGAERTTTIGRERATNPLLQAAGEDAFVAALLGTLGSFPDYFLRLGMVNLRGPAVLTAAPALPALSLEEVVDFQDKGAQVVDVRRSADFAAGHIPGSLAVAFRPAFPTWLGWLADPQRPVVFVRSPNQDPEDIAWAAAKVGFDTLAGELDVSHPDWGDGSTTRTSSLIGAGHLINGDEASWPVVDVRQAAEFRAGHITGVRNVELGGIADQLFDLPAGPIVLMCGRGERALTAASILERAGRTDVAVLDGSAADWVRLANRPLERET